jgi:serine/threonine-protein kinase
MGVVYRAHDERLDRDVALKVLPRGALSDERARRQFRREALALAKLNNPNIATIHDFDTQNGVDFLVMECVQGVTLADHVGKRALPEKQVLALGQQIARALADAHDHGIVHCDLKPGNIMITDGQVKLLDFGLARLLQPGQFTTTESLAEKHIAGTLPYMAPEQLRGELPDLRSDIYAVGVVLFEMEFRPVTAEFIDEFRGTAFLNFRAAAMMEEHQQILVTVDLRLRNVVDLAANFQQALTLCGSQEKTREPNTKTVAYK